MKRVKLAVFGCAMLAVGAANAQDNGDRTIEQYSCKDVMRESGTNRDVAIAFLHGFLIGKAGGERFNVETLRKQTDAFIERCLDNPGVKAVEVMTQVKK
ncbi:MAG: HdeA/HdeB family chaperone [Pseudorhodoplanes sp.]